MVGTVLACLLTGVTASTYCLSLSLLLAFAMLYPEVQLLLFFVIPIRVKYFGFFAAALWVFSFLSAPLAGKLPAQYAERLGILWPHGLPQCAGLDPPRAVETQEPAVNCCHSEPACRWQVKHKAKGAYPP